MAMTQLLIEVSIDTANNKFVAGSQFVTSEAASLAEAISGVGAQLVALHQQLQGVPDSVLGKDGVEFRDTVVAF